MLKRVPSWVLWSLGATLCWGVWGALSGQASKHGSATGLLTGAILIEAVAVAPFAASAYRARSWWLVAMSLIGLMAYWLFFKGLAAGGPTTLVVAIAATYPIITFATALVFFNEKLSMRATVGVILAVAGTALLSTASSGAQ